MVQEKIKSQRLKLGLSREKLAMLSGVTAQTVYRLETSGKINLVNYIKITETLEKHGKKRNHSGNANAGIDNANNLSERVL